MVLLDFRLVKLLEQIMGEKENKVPIEMCWFSTVPVVSPQTFNLFHMLSTSLFSCFTIMVTLSSLGIGQKNV